MATIISSVYMAVIEDVINNVRSDFEAENLDESILNELQSLWELKVMQSGAVSGWTPEDAGVKSGIIPATPVQDLNIPYDATDDYDTPTNEVFFPHMRPLTSKGEPVVYQYIPPGPRQDLYAESGFSAHSKIGKPAPFMQQPATWMTKKLPDVDVNSACEDGEGDGVGGSEQPTIPKDFFTLATGKRKREEVAATYHSGNHIPQQDGANDSGAMHNASDILKAMYQESKPFEDLKAFRFFSRSKELGNTCDACASITDRGISQLDGVNDNYDDDVAEEDYNEPGEEELPSLSAPLCKSAKIGTLQSDCSEPPLNEDDDDDDLDEFDQGDHEPKTNHVILAQFEKVTRSKNKWKCILKDGIMNLNHKDVLFVKGNGEFEF